MKKISRESLADLRWGYVSANSAVEEKNQISGSITIRKMAVIFRPDL
jgi:hypothetical protein